MRGESIMKKGTCGVCWGNILLEKMFGI